MTEREALQVSLYDVADTIYRQIATLRRGLPIAKAKAHTELERLQIHRRYTISIAALDTQYKAVQAAIGEVQK